MPAAPPQMRRVTGASSAPGWEAKIFWGQRQRRLAFSACRWMAALYPLVEVVAAELDGRVGDDADAICAVPAHEAPPALLAPHLGQGLADGQLVCFAAGALHLHEDL